MNVLRLLPLFLAALCARAEFRWVDALRRPEAWYATAEARDLAGRVIAHQTRSGGWPKNLDFATAAPEPGREATIDNNATTEPIEFLARVITATSAEPAPLVNAAHAGLDYLFAAQYPNGGWPQYFPLKKGYYSHITYNDGAMINVLLVLRRVSSGAPPYAFVDPARRARADAAIERGIACILKTQVRQSGVATVWCAQHDERTLAPAWARNYEPPSLSGSESVGIVRFLMSLENPSPEIIAAVEDAAAWFEKNRITGLRYDRSPGADGQPDRRVVPDPSAPPLWARFYELETNRPLFLGRDKVFRYALADIERERRAGYAYYTTAPAELIEKEYPAWRARHRLFP